MKRLTADQVTHIRELRSKGYSIPEISKELNLINSTVFRHAKDVIILPEYSEEWRIKRGGSRKRMLAREKVAVESAQNLIVDLNAKERLLFLCALYWAEGNKKDFILTNTDPNLIRVFVYILRNDLNIEDDRLQVSIRVYEDLDSAKCLSFWSEVVGVPREKFTNIHVLPGKKIGKLQYGMCRIRVAKSNELLKLILALNVIVTNKIMSL